MLKYAKNLENFKLLHVRQLFSVSEQSINAETLNVYYMTIELL